MHTLESNCSALFTGTIKWVAHGKILSMGPGVHIHVPAGTTGSSTLTSSAVASVHAVVRAIDQAPAWVAQHIQVLGGQPDATASAATAEPAPTPVVVSASTPRNGAGFAFGQRRSTPKQPAPPIYVPPRPPQAMARAAQKAGGTTAAVVPSAYAARPIGPATSAVPKRTGGFGVSHVTPSSEAVDIPDSPEALHDERGTFRGDGREAAMKSFGLLDPNDAAFTGDIPF